ncbi:MAG: serine/threonine protein kinase [Planctomycetota bacterium]
MSDQSPGLENVAFSSSSTYTITQELGRGGMGIVYLAEKNCEGVIDHVVLKTIRTISGAQIARLKTEANIATILRHENIVKTYGLESIPVSILPPEFREQMEKLSAAKTATEKDTVEIKKGKGKYYRPRLVPPRGSAAAAAGTTGTPGARRTARVPGSGDDLRSLSEDEKLYCMAMDFVEGTDLGHVYRDHLRADLLMPPQLSAFIISRICRALAYAHQYIVHRDISPENIMVNDHGVAKLTDFGIAVAAGKQTEFAGKILYMSPEQLQADAEIDGRSDIYSLGLVAYQMVTGITVFAMPRNTPLSEAIDTVSRRMASTIPPPHTVRDDVPEILSAIIMKMLAFRPEDRYQNMEDCGNDLEKKYLYAAGFGPTNNSLAAYFRIFENDFAGYDQSDLKQLTFLKNPDTGKLALRRLFSYDTYSAIGQKLLKDTQKDTLLFKVLQRQAQLARQGD